LSDNVALGRVSGGRNARVSAQEQDLALQLDALQTAGCSKVSRRRPPARSASMAQHVGWRGKGSLAATPITVSCFLNPTAVMGEWRSVVSR
jgi:hypothetical protein